VDFCAGGSLAPWRSPVDSGVSPISATRSDNWRAKNHYKHWLGTGGTAPGTAPIMQKPLQTLGWHGVTAGTAKKRFRRGERLGDSRHCCSCPSPDRKPTEGYGNQRKDLFETARRSDFSPPNLLCSVYFLPTSDLVQNINPRRPLSALSCLVRPCRAKNPGTRIAPNCTWFCTSMSRSPCK